MTQPRFDIIADLFSPPAEIPSESIDPCLDLLDAFDGSLQKAREALEAVHAALHQGQ